METKHTKGEWYANNGQIYQLETGKTIALIPYFDNDNKEHKANQKLIEAAPQMLEALEYVIRWHREHDSGEGELFGLDFVTNCIAAKRKATE